MTSSIPKILSKLTKLDSELPKSGLSNLKPFNHTYLIITRNMYEKIESGYFENKQEVERLIINFMEYYFTALENRQKNKAVTKAWELAFSFCQNRNSNRLMYLAIGANAHINNDLAFSLKDTIKNENFYADYQKAGEVIELSVKESILAINDTKLLKIYEIIIKFLLKQWRKGAWNNYLSLMRKNKIEAQIKQTAIRKARDISLISYII